MDRSSIGGEDLSHLGSSRCNLSIGIFCCSVSSADLKTEEPAKIIFAFDSESAAGGRLRLADAAFQIAGVHRRGDRRRDSTGRHQGDQEAVHVQPETSVDFTRLPFFFF